MARSKRGKTGRSERLCSNNLVEKSEMSLSVKKTYEHLGHFNGATSLVLATHKLFPLPPSKYKKGREEGRVRRKYFGLLSTRLLP